MSGPTVKAGEVPPLQQGGVEGGQGGVEEGLAPVGGVPDGVGEQVHLQQGLQEVAQHFGGPAPPPPPPPCTLRLSVLCRRLSLSKQILQKEIWRSFKEKSERLSVSRCRIEAGVGGGVAGWRGGGRILPSCSLLFWSHNFSGLRRRSLVSLCERIQPCDGDPSGSAALLSLCNPSLWLLLCPSSLPLPLSSYLQSGGLWVVGVGGGGSTHEREQVLAAINV